MPEIVLYRLRPAWRFYLPVLIAGGSISWIFLNTEGGAAFILTLLTTLLLIAILRYRHLYLVTEQRLIQQTGLIAKLTNEIKHGQVHGIRVEQSIFERILMMGTIVLVSAAEDEAKVVFKGIANPQRLKEDIVAIPI